MSIADVQELWRSMNANSDAPNNPITYLSGLLADDHRVQDVLRQLYMDLQKADLAVKGESNVKRPENEFSQTDKNKMILPQYICAQ